MPRVYEYYIWSNPDDDDTNLAERIEEALRDANLEFEYNRFEDS
jgi:hypothetical protein